MKGDQQLVQLLREFELEANLGAYILNKHLFEHQLPSPYGGRPQQSNGGVTETTKYKKVRNKCVSAIELLQSKCRSKSAEASKWSVKLWETPILSGNCCKNANVLWLSRLKPQIPKTDTTKKNKPKTF